MRGQSLAGKFSRTAVLWRRRSVGPRHNGSWVKSPRFVSEWLPLCEWPPCSVVPVRKVFEWRDEALEACNGLQTSFLQTGGPSPREMQIEMRWLLEDSTVARSNQGSDLEWKECSWGDLEIEAHKWRRNDADADADECLQMRLTLDDLSKLWRKRIHERVPIQYLTHTAHWRDLVLCVGPGVLIPRPETELLIDLAEEHANGDSRNAPWMDMGTGSGAIAIALAKMLGRGTKVFAIDISPTAVQCTRLNARRCGVETHVVTRQSKWFESVQNLKGKLGGIVSNPPYIPRADMADLQPEVGKHEPSLALDGGVGDGTGCLMDILKTSASFLTRDGFLGLETNGAAQSETMKSAILDTGFFEDAEIHSDYYGVKRFVVAKRR